MVIIDKYTNRMKGTVAYLLSYEGRDDKCAWLSLNITLDRILDAKGNKRFIKSMYSEDIVEHIGKFDSIEEALAVAKMHMMLED